MASLANLRLLFCDHESVYTYYQELGVLFVSVPKTANSSINYLLLERAGLLLHDTNDCRTIHNMKNQLRIPRSLVCKLPKATFSFAFVRNPFDRIVSLYKNKVLHEDHVITRKYFGLIYPCMPFPDFVRVIGRIPDRLADVHFRSQYSLLYDRGRCLVDYIGHYETLANDFRPIQERLHLSALPTLNSAPQDSLPVAYDRSSAETINRRYRKDIMTFGYDNMLENVLREMHS